MTGLQFERETPNRAAYSPGVTSPIPRAHPDGDHLAAAGRQRAAALICMVRDESADTVGPFLDRLNRQDLYALIVVLAAMVPDDSSIAELLAWVTALTARGAA